MRRMWSKGRFEASSKGRFSLSPANVAGWVCEVKCLGDVAKKESDGVGGKSAQPRISKAHAVDLSRSQQP